MSKPSFPFYPDDWMNDLGLRRCSPATRGIWADMLCLMHQGQPYGHLANPGGQLPVAFIAGRCGVSTSQLSKAIAELQVHNVFSRTEDGTIFSRRMVRDEHNRVARAAGGPKALNNPSVPRSKKAAPTEKEGILPSPEVKDSFDPEEVKEEVVCIDPSKKKPSWEEILAAWKFYMLEYPGEVNEFIDKQLFISVMETRQDIAELSKNLPLWKQTKKWMDGYHKESKNFLSERLFKVTPKSRDSPKPEPAKVDPSKIVPYDPYKFSKKGNPDASNAADTPRH